MRPFDLAVFGTAIHAAALFAVTGKLMVETHYFTWANAAAAVTSLCLWFGFALSYSMLKSFEFYGVAVQTLAVRGFYLSVLYALVSTAWLDLACKYAVNQFAPTPIEIVRELDSM